MSAAPAHFHTTPPLYYDRLLTYHHTQFLLNISPVHDLRGHPETGMPERAANASTCDHIDNGTFAYHPGSSWKMASLASSNNLIPHCFHATALPCQYNLFNIANSGKLESSFPHQVTSASAVSLGENSIAETALEQTTGSVIARQLNVAQQKKRYLRRRHQPESRLYADNLSNSARFSTAGSSSNYAMLHDTKLSLSSTPSSPVAGSVGSSCGSYPYIHSQLAMPPSFVVPQSKGYSLSSSSCSTNESKISSSMSSCSSRSSMSSTPSSNGISPRKRQADDGNCSNEEYNCRKIRRHLGRRGCVTAGCACDSCATDEVTTKVDNVVISNGLEKNVSRDVDVAMQISYDTDAGKSVTRKSATRKVKKTRGRNTRRTSSQQQIPNHDSGFIFTAPRPVQDVSSVVDKVDAPVRYNLRSSAKERQKDGCVLKPTPRQTSSNDHMSQSTFHSTTTTGSSDIDARNLPTKTNSQKDIRIPRYHTRSRQKQKKTNAFCQQTNFHKTKNRHKGELVTEANMVNRPVMCEAKPYQLTSVIRRAPSSSTIRQLLSSKPSPPPVKIVATTRENVKSNTKNLSALDKLYSIHDMIGVGGGGTVNAGTRKSDGLQVAIKQVPKAKVKRWGKLNERVVPIEFELLQKASRSCHPGVIRMFDWFERGNMYVLVMERPQPVIDLFDYLNQSGALPEATARNIFRQIAHAVLHCHANGVIHRDIKDENVLLNLHTSEAKLIDFGCGTLLKNSPYTEFAGTPEFYPPEWFMYRSYYGQRVDAWSLGVLLYTMVEAEVPFQKEKDIVECKLRHKNGARLSDECKDLISRMLQKNPESRPTIKEALQHPWFQGPDTPISCTYARKSPNNRCSTNPDSNVRKPDGGC